MACRSQIPKVRVHFDLSILSQERESNQDGFRFALCGSVKEPLVNVAIVQFTHYLIKMRWISGDWI